MTWADAYLIKAAVTAGRLAATAKQRGIPLLGDWRYAAKLLRRQATPAGKAHYEQVAGFVTPEERKLVKRLTGGKDIEVAVTTPAGKGRRRTAKGDGGEVSVEDPRRLRRTLHTHTPVERGPKFRRTEFGQVLPSSGLDTRDMPSAALLRAQAALRELGAPGRENFDRWLNLGEVIARESRKARFPSNLGAAVSALHAGKHYIPLRVGDYANMTARGAAPVSVIFAPQLGTQSVSKVKEGPFGPELRRLYFRKTSK